MGYRSDVTLLMKRVDYDKMCVDLADNARAMSYLDSVDDEIVMSGISGAYYVKLEWYDIKWYDDDIQSYLIQTPNHVYYEFVRIGEDTEDIEVYRHLPHDEECRLYVNREIGMDYSDLSEI